MQGWRMIRKVALSRGLENNVANNTSLSLRYARSARMGVAGLFYDSLLPARLANNMEVGGFVTGLREQRSRTVIIHGISNNLYIRIPTRKKQALMHRRLLY